jgi:hypothetical protein
LEALKLWILQKFLCTKQTCTEKRCLKSQSKMSFISARFTRRNLTQTGLRLVWTSLWNMVQTNPAETLDRLFLHFKNLTLVKVNLHRTLVIFRGVNQAFTDIHWIPLESLDTNSGQRSVKYSAVNNSCHCSKVWKRL